MNALTRREKAKYSIAWVAFIVIGVSSFPRALFSELLSNWPTTLLEVAYLTAFIFACYRCNETGDGEKFFERLLCISWPENVKATLLILFYAFALYFAERLFEINVSQFVAEGVGWSIVILFSWRIFIYIKIISRKGVAH